MHIGVFPSTTILQMQQMSAITLCIISLLCKIVKLYQYCSYALYLSIGSQNNTRTMSTVNSLSSSGGQPSLQLPMNCKLSTVHLLSSLYQQTSKEKLIFWRDLFRSLSYQLFNIVCLWLSMFLLSLYSDIHALLLLMHCFSLKFVKAQLLTVHTDSKQLPRKLVKEELLSVQGCPSLEWQVLVKMVHFSDAV